MQKNSEKKNLKNEGSMIADVRADLLYLLHSKKTTQLQNTTDESETKKILQCVKVFNSIKSRSSNGGQQ